MTQRARDMLLVVGVALSVLGATVFAAGRTGELADLITDADAIMAVEILRTDYSATPSDGPMYGDARILKVLKGRLPDDTKLRFGESAWCGPTHKVGERKILFLNRVTGTDYYASARWAIPCRVSSRIDLFVPADAIQGLSLDSLKIFLKEIQEARRTPPRIEIAVGQRHKSGLALSIRVINTSDQSLWLNPSRVTVSFEANNVRYSPEITFGEGSQDAWLAIASARNLTGSVNIPREAVQRTNHITLWVSNSSVYFPKRCWTGTLQSGPIPMAE